VLMETHTWAWTKSGSMTAGVPSSESCLGPWLRLRNLICVKVAGRKEQNSTG